MAVFAFAGASGTTAPTGGYVAADAFPFSLLADDVDDGQPSQTSQNTTNDNGSNHKSTCFLVGIYHICGGNAALVTVLFEQKTACMVFSMCL